MKIIVKMVTVASLSKCLRYARPPCCVRDQRIAAAYQNRPQQMSSNHSIHDENLSVVRPGEGRRLLFAASPAETQEEGKQLKNILDGQEPPQEVRDWHPEVATALLPNPGMVESSRLLDQGPDPRPP